VLEVEIDALDGAGLERFPVGREVAILEGGQGEGLRFTLDGGRAGGGLAVVLDELDDAGRELDPLLFEA
jgi:hypothetical protein